MKAKNRTARRGSFPVPPVAHVARECGRKRAGGGTGGLAGLSVSEYMRRTIFGGRPVVAAADESMLRELRRIGGLLKHNFQAVQQAESGQEIAVQMGETLRLLSRSIEPLPAHSGNTPMIIKKVKRTGSGKPKAWQIGNLIDYIRHPHNTNAHEKIAHAGSRTPFQERIAGSGPK